MEPFFHYICLPSELRGDATKFLVSTWTQSPGFSLQEKNSAKSRHPFAKTDQRPVASNQLPGPTGFDRMREDVSKHAGSWDESLER